MIKQLATFVILTLVATSAIAQKPKNEIIADTAKYRDMQLDGLGLTVVSYEDAKHVLVSQTGRYVITGTVTDMWDGVQVSDTMPSAPPLFPEMLDADEMLIRMGNPHGEPVLVYVSHSCLMCGSLLQKIVEPAYLHKHAVSVMLVHNNDHDELISQNVFCAKDKTEAFKQLFVERDLSALDYDCQTIQPDFNTKLAIAQGVRALPASYYPGRHTVHFGL